MAKIKAGKDLRALLKEAEDIRGAIADANYILKNSKLQPEVLEKIPRICLASVVTSVCNLQMLTEQLALNGPGKLLEGVEENVSDSDTETDGEVQKWKD